VWRVDVGMSSGVLNAVPQVLEVFTNDEGVLVTRILTQPLSLQVAAGAFHQQL
jgi:hypothetical protein